jgi:hypothetical protein
MMTKKEQNTKIAQEMRQHVLSCQASKMSSREYCAANGLAAHKLYYWLNKFKKKQSASDSNTGGFLRVRPKAVPSTSPIRVDSVLPSMEVNLSNGTRLAFYHAISKELLNLFL